MLHTFILQHRQELIERARAKVILRASPRATSEELANGVPIFLTQLAEILRRKAALAPSDGAEMGMTATLHGADLLQQGLTIAQVVHDYGDVCQAITELAMDLRIPIATEDFQTLNQCLDDSIAGAVTEYARQRQVDASGAEVMRQGLFAHELRNRLNTAMLTFQAVKSGRVGVTGSTIAVLGRSLRGMRDLIDRSVSEVRLAAGKQHRERLRLDEFIEELEIDASISATDRGLRFTTEPVDRALSVDADRQLFASAISNLLQNAFKFTRPSGHVWLRVRSTADRVLIEVEDECGGLPPGMADGILRPYEQRGTDRAGLGLGLVISRQAIEAEGGKLSVRDIPGRGCVFIVDLPLAIDVAVESNGVRS
jgi:hypothetical protein